MRARHIRHVGYRGSLRIYWDDVVCKEVHPCEDCPEGHPSFTYKGSCPNSYGMGKPGSHNAAVNLEDRPGTGEAPSFGSEKDYPEERWPTACKDCGAPAPTDPKKPTAVGQEGIYYHRFVSVTKLYDSPSGEPERGDVYVMDYHHPGECPFWDNCDGHHFWAILPNGHTWDIDSRANNCTMPDERTHRCWVRVGSLEEGNLHVDKNGHTCAAGAGSIAVPGWHGFLHHFNWNGC